MRRRRRVVLGGALLLCVGALTVLSMACDASPLVVRGPEVSTADIRRARSLLRRHDPRRASAGDVRTVSLSRQDATLLTQYAASRWRRASTRITLADGTARVETSVALPSNPFGKWLNIDAVVREADGLPVVSRLRIGGVPVPAALAEPLLGVVLRRMKSEQTLDLARDMVEQTRFSSDSVRVVYRWRPDATGRVRDMLVAPDEVARLEAFHAALASAIARAPANQPISASTLMAPLFALAAERALTGDAAEENRAVLATLALYVTGRRIGSWMRQATSWPTLERRRITLVGREDLAKHFFVSAIVAAQADRTLADAVGVTKELDDSRGGSGFSFADLAADRAGTQFGERAVNDGDALLERLTGGVQDSDIMPGIDGLPESLTALEFEAQFGGVGQPRYNAMLAVIEARVTQLRVLRD